MQLVDDVLEHVSNALVDGENVKISSFGTFSCKQKKERIGRNPKTGIEAPITARKVVTFKPSQIMKEKINKGNQKNKIGYFIWLLKNHLNLSEQFQKHLKLFILTFSCIKILGK